MLSPHTVKSNDANKQPFCVNQSLYIKNSTGRKTPEQKDAEVFKIVFQSLLENFTLHYYSLYNEITAMYHIVLKTT